MRTFIIIIFFVICFLIYFFWSSISRQSLTVAQFPAPTESLQATITTEEASEHFIAFVEQYKAAVRDFAQINESSITRATTSATRSQYAQQATLKPIISGIFNSIQQIQTARAVAQNQYRQFESKPKTALDTEETYKKTKALQLHNIQSAWYIKRDQLFAVLTQQETALRTATKSLATVSIPSSDALISALANTRETEKQGKFINANQKSGTDPNDNDAQGAHPHRSGRPIGSWRSSVGGVGGSQ